MDSTEDAGYVLTGHEKMLTLWNLGTGEKIFEKKPESSRKSGSQDYYIKV